MQDEKFIDNMKLIKEALDGYPDLTFVAQAALSTQKWVQDLREEGIVEPFENWDVEFIIERLKSKAVPTNSP